MEDRRSLGSGQQPHVPPKDASSKEPPPQYHPSQQQHLARPPSTSRPPSFRTSFACVSMHMRDRIRLLRFEPEDILQIQEIVRRNWPRGIQDIRQYDVAHEMKLSGNPWSSFSRSDERLSARQLMCGLLSGLFDMGWVLKASVDISKKEYDKDTLLFRHQNPPPPRCVWMTISFDKGDLMHLIDAPLGLCRQLVQSFAQKVQSYESWGSIFEIKFRGYPWRANGVETVNTRIILLILLETLEQHGFSLYASIDQDNGPGSDSRASEADVWFCNRQADWTPGMPIYHS